MLWFLDCLGRAIDGAHVTLKAVLDKARFWDRIKDAQLNDRQRSVINRLLDGFEGKLTSSKYAKLTKCSQDTAHRDIQEFQPTNGLPFWVVANGGELCYQLLPLVRPYLPCTQVDCS